MKLGAPSPAKKIIEDDDDEEDIVVEDRKSEIGSKKKLIEGDPQKLSVGTGAWWEGIVRFISRTQIIEVPIKCKGTSIYSAASRAVRVAKPAIKPAGGARGSDKKIISIEVSVKERG